MLARRHTMAAMRRKVKDRAEAERLLDQWASGEEGLPEFCAGVGVDGRSLHCWALNLGRVSEERRLSEVGLVEVTVGSALPRAASVYRVVVGDLAVEVDDAFREDTLARLLRVVARC